MAGSPPQVTNDGRRFHEIAGNSGEASPKILVFDQFVLDPESGQLRDGDRPLPLAPKPFETLLYLAGRPGRVVSKTELIEKLWPATFVTEDVLVQCVVDIRRALGDSARQPRYVQTIPRKGYQFLAEVQRVDRPPGTRHEDGLPGPALVEPVPASPGVDLGPAPAPAPTALRRGRLWAALGTALVGAGLAVFLMWLTSTPRSGVAGPEPLAGSVVVLPIEVQDPAPESRWLRHGLAEILAVELGHRPGVHAMARHRLASALLESGLSEDARMGPREAIDVGRRLGAERVASGSFVRVQDRFVLTAQVVEVATGRTEGTATARGKFPEDLLSSLEQVSQELAEHWNIGDVGSLAAPRPARLGTRSVDAYRHYVEALEWFARGGQRGAEEAERRLDESVRLDPGFAYAYLSKAEIQQWRGRWGYGDPDPAPAVEKARALSKDLPERERLLVEMMHCQVVGHDPAAALKVGESLMRLYPAFAQEVGVPAAMGGIYYLQGRWDDLILVGRDNVDSSSMPAAERARLSDALAKAYRQKGEHEAALVAARRAVKLWPLRDGPSFLHIRTDLGRLALNAGRRDEALTEFRAVSSASEADASNLTDAAWGLYMASEPREAATVVDRALGMDDRYGNAHHLKGWLHLATRQWAEAAASFQMAHERTPRKFGDTHLGFVAGADTAALYYSGVAQEKAGDAPKAHAIFRRVVETCRAVRTGTPGEVWEAGSLAAIAAARLGENALQPPRLPGDDATYFLQSARLHAVQGKREQALRELGQALQLAPGERQHALDDPNFESLHGDADWRRVAGVR